MDEELTNREEELEAGEVGKPSFFYRQFLRNKGTSRDTLKYVPYPAVSAVLRGVWVRIRPYL
ncbi:hypothetical protein L249_5674 [Ophiocordyceps polyrhachis-furcata BCC 54312]|uniref:Uncharacterized protein n=1 Tax=Ophiocordyceps polyrhachis-furcata BCC 54312 TaxID=1330021 RepID=A0A367KZT3_9HYPO|nr:hypothetical protein L249_5674 [Ophiocordyceps polyrhachis-furcata BCC 54312]